MVGNILAIVAVAASVIAVPLATKSLIENFRDPGPALWRVEVSAEAGYVDGDPHLRRARVRCQLPIMFALWSLPLYFSRQVVLTLTPGGWSAANSAFFDISPSVVEFVAVGLLLGAIGAAWAIIHFNWPKILVPRGMECDPGLLEVRRMTHKGGEVHYDGPSATPRTP